MTLLPWRDQVERPDERLEDWMATLENRNFVDMNVMPVGTIAGFKPDNFQRSLDPENFRLHLRGQACDLRQVADELRKVDNTAQTWLRTHQPW